MGSITVIYITDNVLDEGVSAPCRKHLLKATEGLRLITVSQKPMKQFGDNICVGDMGRSGYNIDYQIKAGLDLVDTDFIAIAEHDCLYTREHFDFEPPDKKYFYYNKNNWLLQYYNPNHMEMNGMFSFVRRKVQSQLIASTAAMMEATKIKLEILSHPKTKTVWPGRTRLGEPGTTDINHARKVFRNSGLMDSWPIVEDYLTRYEAKFFRTKAPNIDIRHGNNLSGVRRGKHRRWELEPWGKMEDILNV